MAGRDTLQWKPGLVVRKTVDGATYYGQFLDEPWAAFLDLRTTEPLGDAAAIVQHAALFTVSTGYPLVEGPDRWEAVGLAPIPEAFAIPETFAQSPANPERVQIVAPGGAMRASSVEEVQRKGLWAATVWNPEHVESALVDHFAGRPNRFVEDAQLKGASPSPAQEPTDPDPTDQGIR